MVKDFDVSSNDNLKKDSVAKNKWFGKIETVEDAQEAVKSSSNVFIFVGALTFINGFLGLAEIFDALLFIFLGFILKKYKKLYVAVILFILSLLSLIITILNSIIGGGDSNIFLAAILVYAGFRAVKGAWKLKKIHSTN